MPQSWQNCPFIKKVFCVNSPTWFSFTDWPLSCWRNLRKPQSRSFDISFPISGPKLDQHCPIGPKKFWKFHLSNFYHTIVPYIAAKFGKNAYSISWGIGLDNFVPNRAKIAHLVHKRIFQEILFKWFLSTYSALLCCKV